MPPLALVVELSACWNSWNSLAWSASEMPGPVSRTDRLNEPLDAEALITTVVGLAVAIPAVIAYNHYASKLNLFTSELEGFASEFVGTLAREGRV